MFYLSVRRMLGELEGATTSLTSLRDKRRGYVRIAAPPMMSCTLIQKAVAAYVQRYRDVAVRPSDTRSSS